MATYWEIETHWTIDDLFDAHEILDIKDEMTEDQRKEQERKNK
jgi:hypothetical protein